jgi:protein-disulfide isomerase
MAIVSRIKASLDVMSSVALIVAASALIWTVFFRDVTTQPSAQRGFVSAKGLSLDTANIAHMSGKGPLAIVEFTDYECPFCTAYAKDTFPLIEQKLINSDYIRYVVMHSPLEDLHPFALQASEASECAGKQGRFWEMHKRLFNLPKPATHEDLLQHGEALGLTSDFVRCLDSHEMRDRIRRDQAQARRLNVTGTPTFFIGTVRADGGIDFVKRIDGIAPAEVFLSEVAELGSEV